MPASASIVSSSSYPVFVIVVFVFDTYKLKGTFINKFSQKHLQNQPGGHLECSLATAFGVVLVLSHCVVVHVVTSVVTLVHYWCFYFSLCMTHQWRGFSPLPLSFLHLSICRIAR